MAARSPKVTVRPEPATGQSPSDALVQKALQPETVTDRKGRKLTIRKPNVLAQYRLIEALGEVASNQAYMQMVNPLLYLSAIDGDPIGVPGTKDEVEALILRLDDEGMTALLSWYVASVVQPTNDAIKKAAAEKAQLKN